MSAEDNEAGNDDEQEGANLDDTNAVREPVCILGVEHQSLFLSDWKSYGIKGLSLLSVARL